MLSESSPQELDRTEVHAPESAGSPVDWPLNTLARAVDTLSGETPTPHKMMEDTAVCVALLPCPPLSGVPPDGSIRRTGWPRVVTGPGLPQTRTCSH